MTPRAAGGVITGAVKPRQSRVGSSGARETSSRCGYPRAREVRIDRGFAAARRTSPSHIFLRHRPHLGR